MKKQLLGTAIASALALSIAACDDSKNNKDDSGIVSAGDTLALTADDSLVSFNRAAPATVLSTRKITGLGSGESLVGMDFRPSNGKLYGLTKVAVYEIDPITAVAGNRVALASTLSGSDFGVDFNPVVDRLRVINDLKQSLIVDVETRDAFTAGNVTTQANVGTPSAPDASFTVTAAAYTNSITKPVSTRLYDIDTQGDRLFVQNATAADSSLSAPVGLGVDATAANGFDIDGGNNAGYAALTVAGKTGLYQINLAATSAPAATLIGDIGTGTLALKGLALKPTTTTAYALTGDGKLLPFDPVLPGDAMASDALTISGLNSGETVLGIDFRPKDGKLYGITSAARLVTVNTTTGAATVGKSLGLALPLTTGTAPATTPVRYTVDFNPAADRLRVISSTGLNLRIDVDNGITSIDGMLNSTAPELAGFRIIGGAYTNNFAGTTGTALFDIDVTNKAFALQAPPNNGTLVFRGTLEQGVPAAPATFDSATLDIVGGANGLPLLSLSNADGASSLYTFTLPSSDTAVVATSVALNAYPAAGRNQVGPSASPIVIRDIALALE